MTQGRRRTRANAHVPKHVEQKNGNWVYRPYLGVVEGKRQYGPRQTLCSINAPTSELYKAYDRATNQVEGRYTVSWLMSEYNGSPHVRQLGCRDDYEDYARLISGYATLDGQTLGVQPLKRIKKTSIRAYLDKYKGGMAPIAANRHIQYLKAAWNYLGQRDDNIPPNPCEKVTLNESNVRDRYVTDVEMERYKGLCSSRSYMPLAMELAYLCRLRANEVYSIKKEHVEKSGLRVFRGKGSRGEVTAWTVRLREAVDNCLRWHEEITSRFLLHDKKGMPYTMSNHKSQWARMQKKADELGYERFTFHDLKAKGYTDQEVKDAGHKSPKMDAVYDRRGRLVQPANGELPF